MGRTFIGMWRRSGAVLAAVLFIGGAIVPTTRVQGSQLAGPAEPVQPGARMLQSDPNTLTVEWTLPPFSLEQVVLEGKSYSRIVVEGMDETAEPGRPRLPAGATWLALPPSGQVEVEVLEQEGEILSLPFPVQPAPQALLPEPGPGDDPTAMPEELVYRYLPDPTVYEAGATYPGVLARVEKDSWIRSQRVALLRLFPFQYDASRQELQVYRRLRVQVRFAGSALRGGPGIGEPAPFETLFQDTLLNAGQASSWRSRTELPALASSAAPPYVEGPAAKVTLDHDGLYRLDADTLRQAGVPVDQVDPRSFSLYLDGQEVALWIPGEEDGHLDAGEAIFFYGQGIASKFTRETVYWLTWQGPAGRRMPERAAGPVDGMGPIQTFANTVHQESNGYYLSQLKGGDDLERWLWNYLYTKGTPQRTFNVPIDALAAGAYSATLRLLLYGGFPSSVNPDHHVRVYLNDTYVGEGWWDDYNSLRLELLVPQRLLRAGDNAVRLVAPGDTGYSYDLFYLDWIEVTYARSFTVANERLQFALDNRDAWVAELQPFSVAEIVALDIGDPLAPARLTQGVVESTGMGGYRYRFSDTGVPSTPSLRYLVTTSARAEAPLRVVMDSPSHLHSTSNGADYLIIAYGDFIPAVQPLADAYAREGLRAMVVDVQDVYDEFSGGRLNPHAIHDLLAYAYTYWTPPAPTYVLLVGDGHYDYKNYLGYGMGNFIPPYLAYVDPWIGETTADNRYACLVGNDVLADVFLGRLPVNTPQEASAVVAKILAYRQAPAGADWQGRVLFVADNADGGGNFASLSDQIVSQNLPAPYIPDKVYLGINYPYANPALAARAAIVSAINAGRLIVNYIGHGAISFLAAEQMLRYKDVPGMTNGAAQPLFLSWTCYAGRYSEPYPSSPAIGEVFVRAPGSGAIAAWASASLGTAWAHQLMNQGLFDALFQGDLRTLGPATMAGNLRLYQVSPYDGYELDTYVLLGDPALDLAVLPADLAVYPASPGPDPVGVMEVVTLTLSLENLGPAAVHHAFLQARFPDGWSLLQTVNTGSPAALVSMAPLTWEVPALAPGETITVSIQAQVGTDDGIQAVHFTLETTARDVPLDNNEAVVEVEVVGGICTSAGGCAPGLYRVYVPLLFKGE